MRIELVFLGALGICAAAVGCGAKVTVDVGAPGAGGAGGTTTSGTPTNTTGSGTACGGMSCSGSSDGSCDCQGFCNGQKLEVQCVPTPGGGSCTCIENGIKIANCQQPGAATCSLTTGCCASQFAVGTSGSG